MKCLTQFSVQVLNTLEHEPIKHILRLSEYEKNEIVKTQAISIPGTENRIQFS